MLNFQCGPVLTEQEPWSRLSLTHHDETPESLTAGHAVLNCLPSCSGRCPELILAPYCFIISVLDRLPHGRSQDKDLNANKLFERCSQEASLEWQGSKTGKGRKLLKHLLISRILFQATGALSAGESPGRHHGTCLSLPLRVSKLEDLSSNSHLSLV